MVVHAANLGQDTLTCVFLTAYTAAAGLPAVVNAASGEGYVTLIGIDPTFCGHPENTFRLLGNAIFAEAD